MQAIITKYFGPGNVRGSRIKASCDAKSITVPYDYSLSPRENHEAAALELAARLDWCGPHYGKLVSGALPNNSGYAHVFCKD